MSIKLFAGYRYSNKLLFFKFSSTDTCYSLIRKERKLNSKLSKSKAKSVTNNLSIQYFDKGLCTRLKQNGYVYIKDDKDAECIASHLTEGWNEGYILEANPGPGILTKAILNNGVKQLRVFERNEEFRSPLKELSSIYPSLEVIPEDIMFLPSLESRLSESDSNVYDNFFLGIPEHTWEKGIPYRFFSIISGKKCIKFLRYLLAVLPSRTSLFSFGRCEFFLMLSEREYLYMNAEPKENFATYRWTTVLYNLFFEIKCLQTFSTDVFHPVPKYGKKKISKEEHFYLMKLIPQSNLFSLVVNDNKLSEFYFFVRHHLIKRTGLVIPTMESWIPSCGPRLIKEGMHVFTKFGDLSPKQILVLFNQFSSWPEYEDSTFCAALQRYYSKGSLIYGEDENKGSLSYEEEENKEFLSYEEEENS